MLILSALPRQVVASTPISISIPTMIIEMVLVIAMVVLMDRLLFRPIRAAWEERNAKIQAGIEASGATKDEAEEARDEVRRILSEARHTVQAGVDQVSAEGERHRAQLVEEATGEFNRLVRDARVQIQAEQTTAGAQMRHMVIDLALQAASRVSGASYDTPQARELAAEVVAREGSSAL